MDHQEQSADIDLLRWIIVHETPLLGYLGRIDEGTYRHAVLAAVGFVEHKLLLDYLTSHSVTLHEVIVLQTSVVHLGASGGGVQTVITANAHAPHTFMTEGLTVTLVPRAVTLAWTLDEHDRKQLLDKIESIRKTMLAQRVKASGIVLPGGRA